MGGNLSSGVGGLHISSGKLMYTVHCTLYININTDAGLHVVINECW